MRGWIAEKGRLRLVEREDAPPGPEEVCIRVQAAGINRADLAQRSGNYPPPPGASDLLGLECSGTLEAIGGNVRGLEVGQPVCALLSGGGCADRVICPKEQVLPIPEGMDVLDAAGLPEVFATAWLNLYLQGALQQGERVLIHAAGSGVGTAAIQLCRLMGNPCFITAGSEEKIARCLQLGAAAGAPRGAENWLEKVRQFAPDGVDLILDPVGADYLAANQTVLAKDGRLMLIALMGGHQATIHLGQLLMARQHIMGSTLRARSPGEKGRILGQLEEHVWPHFERGTISPVIDRVFDFADAEKAHSHMESNRNFGKILLRLP